MSGRCRSFRDLFTHRGAPWALIGIAFLTLLGAGGVFYRLDPGIHSYWDGLCPRSRHDRSYAAMSRRLPARRAYSRHSWS